MCGIAGIISKTPRTFDYGTFCTLGIANDTRGGDSCGVFIDGKYEYGTGENKLFANYFQESKLLDETKRSTVALVHCRKASVGAISAETAQPVVIKEGDKVVFVVMHNGTIHNYEALAKKYIPEIDIKGMTDSQVMARIFYYKGYDVLSEYNGGAVFAIVDYREQLPKVLLFKGASKKYSTSKDAEDERPLYYCIDKAKQELVFSSIGIYLLALRRDCETYSARSNELLEFNGTDLITIKEYSRDNCTQCKKFVHSTYYPVYDKTNFGKWNNFNDSYDVSLYNSYLTCNLLENTYSYKGKRVYGKLHVNKYGYVGDKQKNGKDIWFFDGVALKNSICFKFLTILRKEIGLSEKEFSTKFENVIRYLSIDGVYKKGDYWYKAITPLSSTLFTGILHQITSTTSSTISSGIKVSSSYYSGVSELDFSSKLELNFKTIREECKSLMK